MNLMNLIFESKMNRKGILHHPATWVVIAFILGAVVMYLAAQGTIPIGINVCPSLP